MTDETSTEWSFSGVLVRLYATICETSKDAPDLLGFLQEYEQSRPREVADVLLYDQYYRWQRGLQRPVEWYLSQFASLNPPCDWRTEMILEEFGYREDHGEPATVEEFSGRFPDFREALDTRLPNHDQHRRFFLRIQSLAKPFQGDALATTRFMNSTVDATAPTAHRPPPVEPVFGDHCQVETSLAEDSPFDQLPPDVMELIEGEMHTTSFQPGEYLMRQGEAGTSLMVLLEGQVEVTITDENGNRRLITRTDSCQVFGEMSLLAEEPRTADVIANTVVIANVLPVESFLRLVAENPSISFVLTKLISQRLGRSGRTDVLSGRMLGGYQIAGRLGRGGMAVVYQARDPETNRQVALKMMSHRLVYDQAALDQFQREADMVESFDHPGITRMHGRFKAFHTYFIVMQYCDGITLRDVIHRNGALPVGVVRKILGQLTSALKYAHEKGVVHRDIKPANVMVNRDGTVMLMDFGLAKPINDSQSNLMNLIVGTPRYMATEQMVGGQVTHAADYFALGCVIHEMLTGEPLFPETDWLNLFRHHVNWQPPDPEKFYPHADREMRDILNGCLQAVAEDRTLPLDAVSQWAEPINVDHLNGFENA